jgi:hypothetical protein
MICEATGYSFSNPNSTSFYLPTLLNFSMNQDFTGSEPTLDRPVAYHPCFMPVTTKEPLGALYLSQAWFWRDKGKKADGWVYKTWWDTFLETGLSQKQQSRIRKILVSKSWWQEKVEKVGSVPTYHYRIDRIGLMAEIHTISEKARKEEREFSESAQREFSESAQREFSESAQREFSESAQREFSESAQREFSLYKDTENTYREYSPDPESGENFSNAPEPVAPPLANNQTATLVVNPNPFDGKKGSVACSMPPDKSKDLFGKTRTSVAQKQRAEEANWLSAGIANKRWKDRQNLDDFIAYVEIYCENRRQDPDLNPNGAKFGKGYRTTILSRTATSQDIDDPYLACWKTWNLEPSAPNYIEPKPEEVAVIRDPEAGTGWKANWENLKAKAQARKDAEAVEKARIAKLMEGFYES